MQAFKKFRYTAKVIQHEQHCDTVSSSPQYLPPKGRLGGSGVERLPSAQGVIPGFLDQVTRRAPCMEPASPSACVSDLTLSLSVSLMNK